MTNNVITRQGRPYDEADAHHIRHVLERETGLEYRVQPCEGGYCIVKETTSPATHSREAEYEEIHLRPALLSQWFPFVLSLGFLLVSRYPEQALVFARVHELQTMLWNVFQHTFNWEDAVGLFEIVMLSIGTIGLIRVFVYFLSRSYYIESDGVETIQGLISRDQTRVEYPHIRGVKLRQSVIQRLLGYGTVEVATSGTDGSEIRFVDIARPQRILEIIRARSTGA